MIFFPDEEKQAMSRENKSVQQKIQSSNPNKSEYAVSAGHFKNKIMC